MGSRGAFNILDVDVDEADGSILYDGELVETLGADLYAPVFSWRYERLKRALDFAVSAFLIALVVIPCAVICAVISLTSPGPIFYREERIGRNGQSFLILKFRSMYTDAAKHSHIETSEESGKIIEWRMVKHQNDPRITPIGRFLRRWSLDELPQLINVLCGEMSLVGPRPIVMSEVGFYGELASYYLAATPGLSGLWQVSGRSNIGYEKRARLDMQYVTSWSLALDFLILFRTIPAVLGRAGAR